MLIGIICIVIGLLRRDDAGGRAMLALGFALGALGGLDTTVREHFAGYRSHTLVLSAFPAVAVTIIAALAGVPAFLVPLLTAGVFLAAYTALRRIWDRTSTARLRSTLRPQERRQVHAVASDQARRGGGRAGCRGRRDGGDRPRPLEVLDRAVGL